MVGRKVDLDEFVDPEKRANTTQPRSLTKHPKGAPQSGSIAEEIKALMLPAGVPPFSDENRIVRWLGL